MTPAATKRRNAATLSQPRPPVRRDVAAATRADAGKIHACVEASGVCPGGQTPLDWSIQGPPGPRRDAGARGEPGPNGEPAAVTAAVEPQRDRGLHEDAVPRRARVQPRRAPRVRQAVRRFGPRRDDARLDRVLGPIPGAWLCIGGQVKHQTDSGGLAIVVVALGILATLLAGLILLKQLDDFWILVRRARATTSARA